MNPTRRKLFSAALAAPAALLPAQAKPQEQPPKDMMLRSGDSTAGFTHKWNALVRKVYGK